MSKNATWQQDAVKLHLTGVMSWREIAKQVGVARSTVSDFLRKYETELGMGPAAATPTAAVVDDKGEDNSRILFISDLHIPYMNGKALEFLAGLKAKYNPTRIICLGDELDKHALSFHDSDPDLMSAGDELRASLPIIQQLYKMFPKMDLIDSNHGSMIYRKAKAHGLPRRYIKSYNDVLGVGDGWKWYNDLTITLPATDTLPEQQVYVHHGKSADAVKVSQAMSMSHVAGHFHEAFAIKYWANPNGLFFAVNAGCLIDDDSYAFAYNNVNLKRPIIGTALIINGVPVLEAMPK